jgi:hypothetical protein
MADINVERDDSPGRYNWAWMVAAVAIVAAFLVWLTIASEPSQVAVVENDNDADNEGVPTVPVAEFGTNPDFFAGERLRVPDLYVQARLGPSAAWVELPDGMPNLVRLLPRVREQGIELQPRDSIAVTGTVVPMTDSILDDWRAQNILETESQRLEPEFALSFLEASSVRVTRPGAAAGGN